MAVTATISDLAAAGAKPDALTLLLQKPGELDGRFLDRLIQGVAEAAMHYGTYVVGGDCNESSELTVSISALGHIQGRAPVLRTGSGPGDLVYLTAPAGAGSSYAFNRFFSAADGQFLPRARLAESGVISRFASSCIDTSDGLIPAVADLMAVNPWGFYFFCPAESIISQEALGVCAKNKIPEWLMLTGPHGDFELLFTIPQRHNEEFLNAAAAMDWQPLLAGAVMTEPRLLVRNRGHVIEPDAAKVANLFGQCKSDPASYYQCLLQLHHSLIQNEYHDKVGN